MNGIHLQSVLNTFSYLRISWKHRHSILPSIKRIVMLRTIYVGPWCTISLVTLQVPLAKHIIFSLLSLSSPPSPLPHPLSPLSPCLKFSPFHRLGYVQPHSLYALFFIHYAQVIYIYPASHSPFTLLSFPSSFISNLLLCSVNIF